MGQVERLDQQQVKQIMRAEFLGELTEGQEKAVGQLRERGVLPEITPASRRFLLEEFRGQGVDPLAILGMRAQKSAAAPETRRAVLEGALGTAASLGPGRLAVRAGRAALGGAAGSGLSERFAPSEQPLAEAAKAGGTMALGEVAGSAVVGAAGRLLNPAGRAGIVQGGREALQFIEERGGTLLPGLASESRFVDILQNVAEFSLFGGGAMARARGKATEIAQESIERFAEGLSSRLGRDELGELVQEMIEGGLEAFKRQGGALYKQVDEVLKQELSSRGFDLSNSTVRFVDLTAIKEEAKQISKQLVLRKTGASAKTLLDDIEALPNRVTFETAANLRSDLLAIDRAVGEVMPGRAKAAARRLSKATNSAMNQAGRRLGGETMTAFREANQFWANGAAEFNSKVINALVRKESPEAVVDTLFQNRKITQIRRVRGILEKTNPNAFSAVQGEFVQGLIARATDTGGQISGKRLQGLLKNFSDASLRELFPDASSRVFMKQLARTLEITQQAATETGIGRMAVQLIQPGAALGMLSGFQISGAIVLVAPAVLAQIMSKPAAARFFIEGVQASPGTKAATSAFTKAATKAGLQVPRMETFEGQENAPG